MNIRISSHVIDRIHERQVMSVESLYSFAAKMGKLLDKYSPARIHQVAIRIPLDKAYSIGKSSGNVLYFMVDIRTRVLCTVFMRYDTQGHPPMAQVVIDVHGNEVI